MYFFLSSNNAQFHNGWSHIAVMNKYIVVRQTDRQVKCAERLSYKQDQSGSPRQQVGKIVGPTVQEECEVLVKGLSQF